VYREVPGILEKVRLTVSTIPMFGVADPQQIKFPVGSMAPLKNEAAPHGIFEDTKVNGLTDTILGPEYGKPITFPFGAKKTDWREFVPVKIFVKFPPSFVPAVTVARHDVLYIAELAPDEPQKNTFPLGSRTAPENCEAPANVGPMFV